MDDVWIARDPGIKKHGDSSGPRMGSNWKRCKHWRKKRDFSTGLPDRVILESGNIIGVIEVKTAQVLHSLDLVQDYKDDAAAFTQGRTSTNSCLYQVEQLCGYLSVNSLQFGVLTTYQQTWFAKKHGSTQLCMLLLY